MASKQQLVRVSPAELSACQRNLERLRELLDYSLPESCYHDADWFPTYFRRLLKKTTGEVALITAFTDAVDGTGLVNEDFPPCEVDEPPTFIKPSRVVHIADALNTLKIQRSWEPPEHVNLEMLNEWMKSEFERSPSTYFEDNLSKLCSFYKNAAEQGEAVMCWWD